MSDKLFIPVILGTNRKNCESRKAADLIISNLESHDDIETVMIDTHDFDFPKDEYGPALAEKFPEYKSTIEKCDGMIIVAPEYNHSYPGALKTLLDICQDEYHHKAVGIASVTSGSMGGSKLPESLLPVVRAFGLSVIRHDLIFTNIKDLDSQKEDWDRRIQKFLDELVWMAEALKAAR